MSRDRTATDLWNSDSSRSRTWIWLPVLLLLSSAYYWLSPPEIDGASSLYLQRSRVLLGEIEPGAGQVTFPGETTWVAYPLSVIQSLGFAVRGAPEESRAEYLTRSEPGCRDALRALWSLLAALTLVGSARLAQTMGRSENVRLSGRFAAASTAAILLLAPALPRAVAGLSSGLWVSLLLLAMAAQLLAAGDAEESPKGEVGVGLVSALWIAMILAWGSFAWTAVPLFFLCAYLRGWRGARLVSAAVVGFILGLALEPARLVDLRGVPEVVLSEWRRGGGWPMTVSSGTADPGFWTSSAYLGHLAALLAFLGWIAVFKGWIGALTPRTRISISIWGGGLWFFAVGLPALAGVADPGKVQLAIVPWIATGSGVGVVGIASRLGGRPVGRLLSVTIGLLAIALALLAGPFGTHRTSSLTSAELGAKMAGEIDEMLGSEQMWLAERPLPGGTPLPGLGLALPRDSRVPDRFDFTYWTRWYAGFDFVLLSVVQASQNLERGSDPAEHFYEQLQVQGKVRKEWGTAGEGGDLLFRLYEIPEEAPWRAPLTDSELGQLTGVPDLSSYLSQLGSLYAEAGEHKTAARIFEAGVELDPESLSLRNNLGSVYLLEQEWESAARVLTQAIARQPDSPELLYNLGRAIAELGGYERAEKLFRRAVNLEPRFADAHYELGRVFIAQDKRGLAAMALRNYLEIEPRSARRKDIEGVLDRLEPQGASETADSTGTDGSEESLP